MAYKLSKSFSWNENCYFNKSIKYTQHRNWLIRVRMRVIRVICVTVAFALWLLHARELPQPRIGPAVGRWHVAMFARSDAEFCGCVMRDIMRWRDIPSRTSRYALTRCYRRKRAPGAIRYQRSRTVEHWSRIIGSRCIRIWYRGQQGR